KLVSILANDPNRTIRYFREMTLEMDDPDTISRLLALNFPKSVAIALTTYTGEACWDINSYLRNNYKPRSEEYDIFKKLIDWSLTYFNPVTTTELCRNERCSSDLNKIMKFYKKNVGRAIQYPAYKSVSQDWKLETDRLMFKIKNLPEKSRAKDIRPLVNIVQPGRVEIEEEAVYKAETCFLIDAVDGGIITLSELSNCMDFQRLGSFFWTKD
ncbi:MAG: hypothetical protein WA952_13880, partial [Lewinella sp.]